MVHVYALQWREDGMVCRWSKDKQKLRRLARRLANAHSNPGWVWDIRKHRLTRKDARSRCVWD